MRLGIMGGTFDPIHYGHLFIAEEARIRYQLDRVAFIPNGSPPHKPHAVLAPAEHRYAMTGIAVAPNAAFESSPIELNRSGRSYTVDTLEIMRREHPGAELLTITGIDALAEILTWKRHEEVVRKTTFIVATRPGFDLQLLKDRLPKSYLERMLVLESTTIGISSTDIRSRVARGAPIRYLTPDGVVDYIAAHHLYAADIGATERAAGVLYEPGKVRLGEDTAP